MMILYRITALLVVCLLVPPTRAEPSDTITLRKDNFHILSDQMRDIIKGLGDGLSVAAMRGSVLAAQQALQRVPGLFPPGSDQGKTHALQVIWSEPVRFDLTYQNAAARMRDLVAATQIEDRDAFGAAAGRMAAACGTCHQAFRSN